MNQREGAEKSHALSRKSKFVDISVRILARSVADQTPFSAGERTRLKRAANRPVQSGREVG
jgi:hypothetical protein